MVHRIILDVQLADAEPIGELLEALDKPLLLAKHDGCLAFTPEGYESAVAAFPSAQVASIKKTSPASDEFAATLDGKVAFARCGRLDAALAAAARDAAASGAPEPVVLLSPACASYDQFRNFEQRGDAFRALVAALPNIELRGRQ